MDRIIKRPVRVPSCEGEMIYFLIIKYYVSKIVSSGLGETFYQGIIPVEQVIYTAFNRKAFYQCKVCFYIGKVKRSGYCAIAGAVTFGVILFAGHNVKLAHRRVLNGCEYFVLWHIRQENCRA